MIQISIMLIEASETLMLKLVTYTHTTKFILLQTHPHKSFNQVQIKVICRNEQKNIEKNCSILSSSSHKKTFEIPMFSFLSSNFPNDHVFMSANMMHVFIVSSLSMLLILSMLWACQCILIFTAIILHISIRH